MYYTHTKISFVSMQKHSAAKHTERRRVYDYSFVSMQKHSAAKPQP